MEYYIGKQFEGSYQPEAAEWCMQNGAKIICLQEEGVRIYEIVEDILPSEVIIEAIKRQLSSSDYKIIKCYEASLQGLPSPYDVAALTVERQSLRDKINILESKL